jgi:hypothetical protein
MDTFDSSKIIKKRGRPKKKVQYDNLIKQKSNTIKKIKQDFSESEIILHLPLQTKDIRLSDNEEEDDEFEEECKNSFGNDIFVAERETDTIFSIDDLSEQCLESKYEQLITTKDNQIKRLLDENTQLQRQLCESNCNFVKEYNLTELDYSLVDKHTNKPVEKSGLACWWCTYTFETMPYFVIDKIIDKKCHVYGNFCTPNCAISYIIQNQQMNCSDKVHLFKHVYKIEDNLCPAPPREVFKRFGGYVDIDDYRETMNIRNREYRCILPPMMSIKPVIEDININGIKKNVISDNLIVKRSKPIESQTRNVLKTFYKN